MHAFLRGDADVLVSTTIIESGLDIPQANTLIVERADALGLAQLYQIRGRVGRSDRTAYAYLLLPRRVRAQPRGARPPGHARRPHRARRRLLDRHARPRDPRRRRPARRRAVRATWPRSGSSSTSSCSPRPWPSSPARAARRRGPCAWTRAWTPTCRPRTSAPRRCGSTCTAASRSSRTRTSCASCTRRPRTATGRCPDPVENLFAIQEAKLKLALLGADYLVFRGGRATVGPLVLGLLGAPRAALGQLDTAVFSSARQEVSLRNEEFAGALRLGRCYSRVSPGRVEHRPLRKLPS